MKNIKDCLNEALNANENKLLSQLDLNAKTAVEIADLNVIEQLSEEDLGLLSIEAKAELEKQHIEILAMGTSWLVVHMDDVDEDLYDEFEANGWVADCR